MKSVLLLFVVSGFIFPLILSVNTTTPATSNLVLYSELSAQEFPTNGSCVGLQSEYGSSILSLTWTPNNAKEFPDVQIIEASLSVHEKMIFKEYQYEYSGDYGDQLIPESPGWYFPENTTLSLECSWNNKPEEDMMDFGFFCGCYGYSYWYDYTDWAMVTAGGSPEVWSGIITSDGYYWIRIYNYAGEQNNGTIKISAKFPAVHEAHVKGATVDLDTYSIEDGEWWLLTTAKDSLGNIYSHSASVNINNHKNIPSTLFFQEISGSLACQQGLEFIINDPNLENNNDVRDDHPLILNILYIPCEIPNNNYSIVHQMLVTDLVGQKIIILWDTRFFPNTASGKLKFILFDGTNTFVWTTNENFNVWNSKTNYMVELTSLDDEKSIPKISEYELFFVISGILVLISKRKYRN